jgi:Xaa-Pro aminopeptidase
VENIDQLQQWLKAHQLHGLVIPSSDEFQNEYVPDSAKRLQWTTHFSGSFGRAIVLHNKAVLFADGRYTTQAKIQTDPAKFEVVNFTRDAINQWLRDNIETGDRIAVDTRIHTLTEVDILRQQLLKCHAELVELADNPIDALWTERPPQPATPIELYPLEHSGLHSWDKRQGICKQMAEATIDAYLLTAPEEIAWLLNIRARDISVIPVALSYAWLDREGNVAWFLHENRISAEQRRALGSAITILPPSTIASEISRRSNGIKVGVNISRTPYSMVKLIKAVGESVDNNLVEQEKSRKNAVELAGATHAQFIDGLAVIRFLSWLDQAVTLGPVSELDAADQITAIRKQAAEFLGVSFRPITASGPNSALAHYSASKETNRILNEHPIFLIDSGGQYLGGTTDITRVVAVGAPTVEHKTAYTLILKGHIGLARVRFPAGTSGSQVDVLARQHLWNHGMDFSHGTGHGVGSYLSVHEGPASISPRPHAAPLQAGMIMSNEPGYYVEGSFGMRLENLVVVTESAFKGYLEFNTITYVPFEPALVDFSLLTTDEAQWLRDYHQETVRRFSAELSAADRAWLSEKASGFISR